jgi:predicted lipoprotein with Yx(FWY)xxD motif
LGDIVVDGRGMTVYIYDLDTPGSGASSCTGQCLVEWPPVTTDTSSPQIAGVGGQIGTIPGPDGTQQITVNGWPLYYYVDDTAPGEVEGQGEDGVWWVLDAAGQKVMTQN